MDGEIVLYFYFISVSQILRETELRSRFDLRGSVMHTHKLNRLQTLLYSELSKHFHYFLMKRSEALKKAAHFKNPLISHGCYVLWKQVYVFQPCKPTAWSPPGAINVHPKGQNLNRSCVTHHTCRVVNVNSQPEHKSKSTVGYLKNGWKSLKRELELEFTSCDNYVLTM